MIRNLLYFIYYPGHITPYHELNITMLKKHWHVFNGDKIITIAYDKNNEKGLEEFCDMFPEDYTIQRIVYNDPLNWECNHFLKMLPMVRKGETFYAHCKGVSRPVTDGLTTWIEHLYDMNLMDPQPLKGKVFSGICAKLLPCPPYVPEPFHYSGSFYWMNTPRVNARLFGLKLQPERYLTERFPAIIAKQEECRFDFYLTYSNESFYEQYVWDRILQKS